MPQISSFSSGPRAYTPCISQAAAYGESGCTCAESVALAFGPMLGMPAKTSRKIASGFAGGIGLSGATCGAATAAILMLGLHFGPETLEDVQSRQHTLCMAEEFMERFCARHGSAICKELCTAGDLRTKEGSQAIRASGMPLVLIRSASEILGELLGEAKE